MCCGALNLQGQDTLLYKLIGTDSLLIEVLYPQQQAAEALRPAVVFFHGGGWRNGNRNHLRRQAKYFVDRGAVCFLVEYRIESKHGTSPFEALADAKSALRYVRSKAAHFQIDPAMIVACGGSAGGHLAAACALIDGYETEGEMTQISSRPDALILLNPVIDNSPAGYGYRKIGEEYRTFSPLHNIKRGAPPTLFLLGTQDKLIPVATARYYQTAMERVGSRCELKLYEGQEHSFFNYARSPQYFEATLTEMDAFLVSLGFLLPLNHLKTD